MAERALSRREQVVDVAVTLAFAAVSTLLILGVVDGARHRAVAAIVATAHIVPLVVRRRWPVVVVACMAATAVISVLAGVPAVVLGPGITVGLFTVGASTASHIGRPVITGVIVVMAGVVVANGGDAGTVITNGVALVVAWWLGLRVRRSAAEVEAERAATAEAAQRAVTDERLRIARELHDVVAHAMSVIAVQAGSGRFVIDSAPEVARDALAAIERTSRDALQEMRRLLSVLRDEGADPAVLLPAPGLDDVPALVREASATSGLDVELGVHGAPRSLPPSLEMSAYRVVQEALTNVRRHSHGTRAAVVMTYDQEELSIAVCDDGVGMSAAAADGHGLIGMRERLALFGGTLEIGRSAFGGFRLVARFPLEGIA